MKYEISRPICILFATALAAGAQEVPLVRFVTNSPAELRSTAEGPRARTLAPGAPLRVSPTTTIVNGWVQTNIGQGALFWIEATRLNLDLSAPEIQADLRRLQSESSLFPGPALVGVDWVDSADTINWIPKYDTMPVRLQRVSAKSAIDPPMTKHFTERDNVMLMEALPYRMVKAGVVIVVPRGFVSDYASVPRGLRWLIGSYGRHGLPAALHDFLYWDQTCSKEQADMMFRVAMEEADTSPYYKWAMYGAVRFAGGPAHQSNVRDKQRGLVRVVPPPFDDVKANTVWRDYRNLLFSKGVSEKPYPRPTPADCQKRP